MSTTTWDTPLPQATVRSTFSSWAFHTQVVQNQLWDPQPSLDALGKDLHPDGTEQALGHHLLGLFLRLTAVLGGECEGN